MKFKKILPVLALSTTPVAFVLAASSCQKNDKVDTEFIAKNAVRIYVNNDDT